jgi:hypothetical protein
VVKRRSSIEAPLRKRLLTAYEDRLVTIYEASMKPADPDGADWPDPGLYWWAALIPGWIDPEWWRWRFIDRGDPEYGLPRWMEPLERAWERAKDKLPYRFKRLEWLWDLEWDPFGWPRWIGRYLCRAGGHKAGIFYYSMSDYGPDTHCKGCGEDIG